MPLTFTDEPLYRVIAVLRAELSTRPTEVLEFSVFNPDLFNPDFSQEHASGERVERGGTPYRYRPFKTWVDLAERLGCRLLTPVPDAPQGAATRGERVRLRFLPLPDEAVLPATRGNDASETYGIDSPFSRLQKLEEPCFLLDYSEALERTKPPSGGSVLSLGVNTGDEFAHFQTLFGGDYTSSVRFTGVDHSKSALDRARARFPGENFAFLEADIDALNELGLGRFDLIISIATLQSPGVDGRETVRRLVQEHLVPTGGLILGFPNCRYRGGEVVYGAKLKNFRRPDLSLLVKDVMFYKKYLQQHRFQVFLTGKYYLFLTAFRRG